MAIDKDKVAASVEQFLPTTITYAVSSSSGQTDPEAIYERIAGIIAIALSMDPGGVYYIVRLAVDKWAGSLTDSIDTLDKLSATDALKGAEAEVPEPLSDFSDLQKASASASSLSASVEGGADVGEDEFDRFDAEVTDFVESGLVDMVTGGNRAAVDKLLRSLTTSLETSWADVVDKRSELFDIISGFETVNLKAVATKSVAQSVDRVFSVIQNKMEDTSGGAQGVMAEQVLIDVIAAKSAMETVATLDDTDGETCVEPTEHAYTDPTWKLLKGIGVAIPGSYIVRGTGNGRLFWDYKLASSKGKAANTDDAESAQIICRPGHYTFEEDVSLFIEVDGEDAEELDIGAGTYPASVLAADIDSALTGATAEVDTDGSLHSMTITSESSGDGSSLKVTSDSSEEALEVLGLTVRSWAASDGRSFYLKDDTEVGGSPISFLDYFDQDDIDAGIQLTSSSGDKYSIRAASAEQIEISPSIPSGTTGFVYVMTGAPAGTLFYPKEGDGGVPSKSMFTPEGDEVFALWHDTTEKDGSGTALTGDSASTAYNTDDDDAYEGSESWDGVGEDGGLFGVTKTYGSAATDCKTIGDGGPSHDHAGGMYNPRKWHGEKGQTRVYGQVGNNGYWGPPVIQDSHSQTAGWGIRTGKRYLYRNVDDDQISACGYGSPPLWPGVSGSSWVDTGEQFPKAGDWIQIRDAHHGDSSLADQAGADDSHLGFSDPPADPPAGVDHTFWQISKVVNTEDEDEEVKIYILEDGWPDTLSDFIDDPTTGAESHYQDLHLDLVSLSNWVDPDAEFTKWGISPGDELIVRNRGDWAETGGHIMCRTFIIKRVVSDIELEIWFGQASDDPLGQLPDAAVAPYSEYDATGKDLSVLGVNGHPVQEIGGSLDFLAYGQHDDSGDFGYPAPIYSYARTRQGADNVVDSVGGVISYVDNTPTSTVTKSGAPVGTAYGVADGSPSGSFGCVGQYYGNSSNTDTGGHVYAWGRSMGTAADPATTFDDDEAVVPYARKDRARFRENQTYDDGSRQDSETDFDLNFLTGTTVTTDDVDYICHVPVVPGDILRINSAHSDYNNGDYVIHAVEDSNTLWVETGYANTTTGQTSWKIVLGAGFPYENGRPGPYGSSLYYCDWEIARPDVFDSDLTPDGAEIISPYTLRSTSSNIFQDYNATFLTDGVVAGDEIHISTSGDFAGVEVIEEVLDETTLRFVNDDPSTNEGRGLAYTISLTGSATDYSMIRLEDGDLYASRVEVGDYLVISGHEEDYYLIEEIIDGNTVTISPGVDVNDRNFIDGEWSIKFGAAEGYTERPDIEGAVFLNAAVTCEFTVSDTFDDGATDLNLGDADTDDNLNIRTLMGENEDRLATLVVDPILDPTTDEVLFSGARCPILRVGDWSFENKDSVLTIGVDLDTGDYPDALPSSAAVMSWRILIGPTTPTFTGDDSVDALEVAEGDVLILNPGEDDEERATIATIDDPVFTLEREVEQGQEGISYAVLPASYPNPGMDLVTAGTRVGITSVERKTNAKGADEIVLVVNPPLSPGVGVDINFFVTQAGQDPFTTYIEDEDPTDIYGDTPDDGFETTDMDIEGASIRVNAGGPSVETSVDAVVDEKTIQVALPVRLGSSDVSYTLLTDTPGTTYELKSEEVDFTALEALGPDGNVYEIAEDDILTIWTVPPTYPLSSTTPVTASSTTTLREGLSGEVSFTTDTSTLYTALQMESGQSNLIFTVVRGGSIDRGRYLLLQYVNSQIGLEDSIRALSLHVAEVLHKHGEDKEFIAGVGVNDRLEAEGYFEYLATHADPPHAGGNVLIGVVVDDGDEDERSPTFDISNFVHNRISTESPGGASSFDMDFATLGIRVGDRLAVNYIMADDITVYDERVVWVTSVSDPDGSGKSTRLTVEPELPLSAVFETGDGEGMEGWEASRNFIESWKIERSSISYALYEADYLRSQVAALKAMADNYTVGSSDVVDSIFVSLVENGLDRAKDLLLSGQVEEFFGLDSDTSTYSGRAKAALNSFAKKLV